MEGFVTFLKEQGVVGLAVGFILGGAVSKLVASIVENILNPVIGMVLGKVDLAEMSITLGSDVILKYGAVISTVIDFVVIAAFIYWAVKKLGLDKLDAKKEDK